MLGVRTDATWEDIKRAYRDLARQYHPDLNQSQRATEKMQEINAAYAHLMSHFDERTARHE
jgi:molecular chaperone DnaJ